MSVLPTDTVLAVTFATGSRLQREQDHPSDLPIHRNGPPDTFVILSGLRISLPTDQIVQVDERDDHVIVTFGGFQFDGQRDRRLVCTSVRELWPEHERSPGPQLHDDARLILGKVHADGGRLSSLDLQVRRLIAYTVAIEPCRPNRRRS